LLLVQTSKLAARTLVCQNTSKILQDKIGVVLTNNQVAVYSKAGPIQSMFVSLQIADLTDCKSINKGKDKYRIGEFWQSGL
jgi:hypothetical protein